MGDRGILGADCKRVCVGYAEHEILWLRAAIANGCRIEDFIDIASMTSRSVNAVREMAYKLRKADLEDAKARARVLAAMRKPPKEPAHIPLPTVAALMAGRATSKRPSHFRDALRGFA